MHHPMTDGLNGQSLAALRELLDEETGQQATWFGTGTTRRSLLSGYDIGDGGDAIRKPDALECVPSPSEPAAAPRQNKAHLMLDDPALRVRTAGEVRFRIQSSWPFFYASR
jgi:hypothetical protein